MCRPIVWPFRAFGLWEFQKRRGTGHSSGRFKTSVSVCHAATHISTQGKELSRVIIWHLGQTQAAKNQCHNYQQSDEPVQSDEQGVIGSHRLFQSVSMQSRFTVVTGTRKRFRNWPVASDFSSERTLRRFRQMSASQEEATVRFDPYLSTFEFWLHQCLSRSSFL